MTDTTTTADHGKILYERFMRTEYHADWDNLPAGTRDRWRDAAAAVAAPAEVSDPDNAENACHVCGVAFFPGDPVYWSEDGNMHAACCGPERESFFNDDEAPLAEGEPIPRPLIWHADFNRAMSLADDAVNDAVCVDRFALAMKAKLARDRAKGRDGWNDPSLCSMTTLSAMLLEHVAKGDPLDVANFAMMIHQRGGRIEAPRPKTVTTMLSAEVKEARV